MVTAVNFFATSEDESTLLDYLGEPRSVSLHPWPLVPVPSVRLNRGGLGLRSQVMVVNPALGQPRVMRPDDPSMQGGTRAAVFNRLNWDRMDASKGQGLVDSNSSPVLLWVRGSAMDGVLHQSQIGSQADSIAAVSQDYERWVARVLGWVRRRGTRVWGLEGAGLRPDLDVSISHISSIYALPHALTALESGAQGRY